MDEQERINQAIWQEIKETNKKLVWAISYKFAIALLVALIVGIFYIASVLIAIRSSLHALELKLAPYIVEYKD